ncbi:MAG: hypothetical protein QW273_02055 [Candidatus Pacearchaeota archaeon]
MRQKLEQVLYEVPRVQERERVYRVIDLDYLSASVLYSDKLHKDFSESSWGKSFETDLYIKKTDLGDLHVHCTKEGLITGANLNGRPISNYEAALIDLLPGKSFYKKGFGKW